MKEDFLAFVWQHQYFDATDLSTNTGEPLTVFRPGYRNTNSGPDFLEARIEIGGLLWVGTVELHIKTSDWNLHHHEEDQAYESVILHVVWENDLAGEYPNTQIPVLTMKDRVDPGLLHRYAQMDQAIADIPCENMFPSVSALEKSHMLDRSLIERLERKSKIISNLLERNQGSWDETAWQLLSRYFGAKINAEAFQKLAENIPLKILLKHRGNRLQLEALLFGTAGLIPGNDHSSYVTDLRREYQFLTRKYSRDENEQTSVEWKLLRLRPAGFPTVRIAQLAALIERHGNLFSLLTAFNSAEQFMEALRCIQSPYWHTHFHFSKEAKSLVPPMGNDAIRTLIINAVAPLLAAYGYSIDDRSYVEKAIGLLEELPPENNKITRKWGDLGLHFPSAAYSQGATEWYERYCLCRRCLQCNVGNLLIRTDRSGITDQTDPRNHKKGSHYKRDEGFPLGNLETKNRFI